MKRMIALLTCALLTSVGLAQESNIDNSKLQPLIGDWTGTTKFHEMDPTPSTMKGSKTVGNSWIRVELKFELAEMGPVEALALLCSDGDGGVEGHFFISTSSGALTGKGKIVEKKLSVNAVSLDGGTNMRIVFDMSVADTLKFSAEDENDANERFEGTYTRKK